MDRAFINGVAIKEHIDKVLSLSCQKKFVEPTIEPVLWRKVGWGSPFHICQALRVTVLGGSKWNQSRKSIDPSLNSHHYIRLHSGRKNMPVND